MIAKEKEWGAIEYQQVITKNLRLVKIKISKALATASNLLH